jgi:hypothetical protein
MDFFVNKEDLSGWVRNQKSSEEAVSKILDLVGKDREQDITETCKAIYDKEDDNAANVLFGVLAEKKLTTIKQSDSGDKMNKQAQSAPAESRQRNGWVRGMRNKWNRVVDGFNDGTPWRTDRDKFYDFTHYYTDAISFDADPTRVYSGEAIWRMYIMDKFTSEYQNKDGKWVGGYINDRFHVFPTAGTPANPDTPRDGGNQLGLPPGIKTRKPRPHQYSVERRLEEARKEKTEDLDVKTTSNSTFASTSSFVKIASKVDPERENDKVYSIFRDVLDMRDAGIDYETILEKVSEHYNTSIINVAQIDKEARKLKNKHSGVLYESGMTKTAADITTPNQVNQTQKKNEIIPGANYTVKEAVTTKSGTLLPYTQLLATEDSSRFEVVDSARSQVAMGTVVVIPETEKGKLEQANLIDDNGLGDENVQPQGTEQSQENSEVGINPQAEQAQQTGLEDFPIENADPTQANPIV